MKPEYEKILAQADHSYTVKTVNRSSRSKLSQAWHYHPEMEICYTVKSSGRRFVGNQISDYREQDFVMFGSNLPHGFVTGQYSSQVVIQMNKTFLGEGFINRPELRLIRKLFHNARQGIEFKDKIKERVIPVVEQITQTSGMQQLILVLSLLHILSESRDISTICSENYALNYSPAEFGRLKIVYDHIMKNYRKEPNVREIAQKLNLSEAGFYKFIKKQSQKTYIQIINEFRINRACRLLVESEKSTSEISYACGFNNQSYFNRKFRAIMGMTPTAFRIEYNSLQEPLALS